MIYKFPAKDDSGYSLELQINNKNGVDIDVVYSDNSFGFEMSKETLHDFIGALLSIQSKLKNK